MFTEMAKIKGKVNWMKGWANSPKIELFGIKVPEWPEANNPVWERTPNGLHLARIGDFAFYFFTDGKPTQGYGGRTFVGTLKDGTKFAYRGAWSSRAGCINDAIARRELTGYYIVDVSVEHYATAVSIFTVNHCGIQLYYNPKNNEIVFEPTHNDKFKGDEGFEYPEE